MAGLLGGNAGEVAFAITGTALTGRSPLNTRQLLLINMLTDALPAAALAVSAPAGRTSSDRASTGGTVAGWRSAAPTAGRRDHGLGAGPVTGRRRRASTVALVALVATQLGQTLIDSHSPLVLAPPPARWLCSGPRSAPRGQSVVRQHPVGPIGWAQATGSAGAAILAVAAANRLRQYRDSAAEPAMVSASVEHHDDERWLAEHSSERILASSMA